MSSDEEILKLRLEIEKLRLGNERLKLQCELKTRENAELNLRNMDAERERAHELEMIKRNREYKSREFARMEHEVEMTRLKNDHALAMKDKSREISQIRLEIEREKSQRHNNHITENERVRQHKEEMMREKTQQQANDIEATTSRIQKEEMRREENGRYLFNTSLGGLVVTAVCGAIQGTLGAAATIGTAGAVVGAAAAAAPVAGALAFVSGVGWVYIKAKSPSDPINRQSV